MKKSALIITIINGLVTAVQIVGQIIIARLFGARAELDAFVSAVTIPTILTTVVASTLNDAFLPILKKKQLKDEGKANEYFFRIAFVLGVATLGLAFILDAFSGQLTSALFGARGSEFVQTTDQLMRYMLYTIPFTVVGTFSNSYLYSKKKFFLPSIGYLLSSILNLALIFALSPSLGIASMVVGFIAAIILQIFIVFPYGVAYQIASALKAINFRKISGEVFALCIAWLPLIISSLVLRFDNVLARSFSARLPEGYIVYVNLATKLFAGLVGIMTIGIQTVFFPHLIELVQSNNVGRAVLQVKKAKLYGTVLTLSAIFTILVFAPFFMRLLLTGGKFSGQNVETLISLFPYFVIPAIGWGVSQIFFQPVIAIGKQYLLTVVNIIAVALSWLGAEIAYKLFDGLTAISVGLIVLTLTGIIGAEIIWQTEKKKLHSGQ